MIDKKRTGRPIKLTAELQDKICSYIAQGNYLVVACKAVGIHPQTLRNWLEQGETDIESGTNSIYCDFMLAVQTAEAEAESAMVAVVREAAIQRKEWIPAMTFLERRHPDRWSKSDVRIPVGNTGITLRISHVERTQLHQGEGNNMPRDSGASQGIVEGECKQIE